MEIDIDQYTNLSIQERLDELREFKASLNEAPDKKRKFKEWEALFLKFLFVMEDTEISATDLHRLQGELIGKKIRR